MKKLTLIAALLLAGCSGGDSPAPPAEQPPPAPAPTPTVDAFVTAVGGVLTAPEQSEPASIDSLAATAPEDSDPSAL